jgi:putative flippase GtrA
VNAASLRCRRFAHLIRELARFLVVGATGLLVTDGAFNLMISERQAALTANAVATLAAAVVTFLGSRYWTFRHRRRAGLGRETVTFIAANLAGILIQQACLVLASRVLGAGYDKIMLNAAFLAGLGLATGFRFWSYRRYVWPARSGNGGNVGDVGLGAHPERALLAGGHDEDLAHAR